MKINWSSVAKAGGAGAVLGALVGLSFAGVGLLGESIAGVCLGLVLCCGIIGLPSISGALYGYFTEGEESMGEAALGGAIAGTVSIIFFGVVAGLLGGISSVAYGGGIGGSIAGTIASSVCCLIAAPFFGGALGAIGGVLWTVFQKKK